MRSCVRILLLLVLSAGFSQVAHAAAADFVDAGDAANQNFGTWAIGDGDQTITDVFCNASANYDSALTEPIHWILIWLMNPDPQRYPYRFKVTDLSTPPGYYIYLDGNDANVGNARIPVTFDHRDSRQPTTFESLSDDVYDGHAHLGQYNNCGNGENSELRISLAAAQLQQARAGTYQGNFRVGVIGGTSGNAVDTDDFTVEITVGQAVQVSGLANINLGTWDGISDVTAEEPFCVYSNNNTAGYSMAISSPNQDVGNNFFIVNAAATDSIPYELRFKDDVSPGGGTLVGGAPISGNGNNQVPGCGGIDNAKLSVNIQAADMAAAGTDTYTDTVTLFVVPL